MRVQRSKKAERRLLKEEAAPNPSYKNFLNMSVSDVELLRSKQLTNILKVLGDGGRGTACDLSLLPSARLPCPSFRRKTESSLFKSLLDPGFRRGDDRTYGSVLKSQALGGRGTGRFSKHSFPRQSCTLESTLALPLGMHIRINPQREHQGFCA